MSAFSSVSLEPPSVLICINREARSYLFIATSRIFCVNVLSANQRSLAERFSGKVREKQFADVAYYIDRTGAAVLEGTLAHIDCEVLEEHPAGSHSIFIGKVISCSAHEGEPLIYYNGTFARFGMQAS